MALKVVGAGLGRTGTHSLKIALEQLLGEPCYHMAEVFQNPQHVPGWHGAAEGRMPDWEEFLTGYGASVDWPASAFWKEQSEAFPDSLILLSTRDAESWWNSASKTIFNPANGEGPMRDSAWFQMVIALFNNHFVPDIHDKDACIAAYNRHNEEVLRSAPADRLLVWQVSDGWGPICERLGLPVPAEPFPVTNTTEEFLRRRQEEKEEYTAETR